jgi:hypothetical protein
MDVLPNRPDSPASFITNRLKEMDHAFPALLAMLVAICLRPPGESDGSAPCQNGALDNLAMTSRYLSDEAECRTRHVGGGQILNEYVVP